MSGLVFKLREAPAERVDLSGLTPSKLSGLSETEIENIVIGAEGMKIADVFSITGAPGGDSIVIEASSDKLDFTGAGLDGGSLIVDGSVGNYAGTGMTGGRLDIRGNAGAWLASGHSGGLITVKGSAGDFAGAPRSGDKQGMAGGTGVIEGNVGERAGDRLRRGTIITRGTFGPAAGSRMMGGTLWTEQGFGPGPGALLRRGTLIGTKADHILATYADCGVHDLVILRIMNRHFAEALGPLAPKPLPPTVRRYAGDLASLGKGEIWLTG